MASQCGFFFFLFRKTTRIKRKPSHIRKQFIRRSEKLNQYTLFPFCLHLKDDFAGRSEVRCRFRTWHHETARSPEAPDPPAVCFPCNSSLPDHVEPSCGGCAGWASEWAVQIALMSRCWSTQTQTEEGKWGCAHLQTHRNKTGTHLPEKSEKAEADMNMTDMKMTPRPCDEIVCNCCQAMIQIHWLIAWLTGTQSYTLQCHFLKSQ